ncbi:hypothetical protein PG993_013333 [Apiospora rasikravindrae]|uniref:Uncharacterized protein n=1 Tax=Apiospora rasikravindrae TaxID=990691 RepID=A0ABR1RYX8_9PEZI
MTRLTQPPHLTTDSSPESQLRILFESLQVQEQSQSPPAQTQTQKSGDFDGNGCNPVAKHNTDSLARLVIWTCIYWDLVVLLLVAVGSATYSTAFSEAGKKATQLFITRVIKSVAYQTLYLGD